MVFLATGRWCLLFRGFQFVAGEVLYVTCVMYIIEGYDSLLECSCFGLGTECCILFVDYQTSIIVFVVFSSILATSASNQCSS